MSAATTWAEQLRAWALPEELLAAVPDSPYEWPAELWRRRSEAAADRADSPTTTHLRSLLGSHGTLLDVGAGTGAASLRLAAEGHILTAVERNPGMVAGLREQASATGVGVTVVEGSWPEVAAHVERHDAVVCSHVVYDVQDIAPFLEALHRVVRAGVVLEMTPAHPWHGLAPYYRALHDLTRPAGPTVGDLAEVVAEVLGVHPRVERWKREGGMRFAARAELVEFLRRRLLVPMERIAELETVVGPDIVTSGEWFMLGPTERELATVWWRSG